MRPRRPSSTSGALRLLRRLMRDPAVVEDAPIAAYVVPSADAHNSEYLAERDQRRAFISGFDGSAGTAVVTAAEALLWTDARYHLQASQQLDENWTLMKEGLTDTPTRGEWLVDNLQPGEAVGVDPFLLATSEWTSLSQKLSSGGLRLIPVAKNLVDKVWAEEQPSYPENPVLPHDLLFAGRSWQEKVEACREKMKSRRSECLVLSALDDIAWLLNLRGSDIRYNPCFFSYAAVTAQHVFLFISEKQVTNVVRQHLDGVVIKPYGEVNKFIEDFCRTSSDKKVWLPNQTCHGLVSLVPEKQRFIQLSPVCEMKAVKNDVEMAGFINCHIRDAAALCCFFAWLEKHVSSANVTEVSAADRLEELRAEQEHFVGLSFATISAVGANAAVIHYRPNKEDCRMLTTEEVFLVDSGAQYRDGTTDVTRTLHFGTPTDFEKECFTRVLKGQMRLARAVFPNKTVGNHLDSFARASLWEVGLDYGHGTGHGVGSYLNVHEGPMGISWRPYPDDPGLQENMVLSDEPGYYEDGRFGIRLENLVRVVRANTKHNFGGKTFLTFEPLTLVPIQSKMIDPTLLTADEIEYLNEYHEKCREVVAPLLREMEHKDGLAWLIKETQPIG